MRKLMLLVAVLALAAMPSVADAAKKGKKYRHHAVKPAATKQEMPGEPGARVIGGYFRELSKIGQPPAPAKKKRTRTAKRS